MHARIVRSAAAVAVTVAGTLAWAPAPSPRTDPLGLRRSSRDSCPGRGQRRDHHEGHGGRRPARRRVPAARLHRPGSRTPPERCPGEADLPDLAPGIYRLKQTGSGSPLYDVVADQDVIVTPGNATRLTITDPFKAAQVLLQAKDDKTGKLLPGATVNIGTGTSTLLTLTTGATDTASGDLPVSSRSTKFWVKKIKAPAGYDPYKPIKTFTAGPGAPVTVTVTNPDRAALGGHPADRRLHPHRSRPRVRRDPDALP